ncbi:MAG TPA: response regulator [Stellaceae bacterium]|nr:response regulator [Stellaceae bacterium]
MPKILVVEDRTEVRDVIALFLCEAGHSVTALGNGTQGHAALEHQHFDVVIVDAVLPGLSGLKLAEIATACGAGVILCSGEPETIAKFNGNSPYVFLQKPFRLRELEAMLRTVIAERTKALGRIDAE